MIAFDGYFQSINSADIYNKPNRRTKPLICSVYGQFQYISNQSHLQLSHAFAAVHAIKAISRRIARFKIYTYKYIIAKFKNKYKNILFYLFLVDF